MDVLFNLFQLIKGHRLVVDARGQMNHSLLHSDRTIVYSPEQTRLPDMQHICAVTFSVELEHYECLEPSDAKSQPGIS